ncbi:hypothetical protein EG328_005344 [Venturia inaequalis]|uniref:Uncharacterized protein n=2 Tax=Venturia inaequalis TaxID=5025 RepID=A0A8H3ULS5_VENIN|nr:hypothetical protein EG328_005344 [Venturia inaequalis]
MVGYRTQSHHPIIPDDIFYQAENLAAEHPKGIAATETPGAERDGDTLHDFKGDFGKGHVAQFDAGVEFMVHAENPVLNRGIELFFSVSQCMYCSGNIPRTCIVKVVVPDIAPWTVAGRKEVGGEFGCPDGKTAIHVRWVSIVATRASESAVVGVCGTPMSRAAGTFLHAHHVHGYMYMRAAVGLGDALCSGGRVTK